MDKSIKEFVKKIKKEHDDDVVDRTNYATTVYLLGFFAILIMAKQYVGEPLQCWLPAEYKVRSTRNAKRFKSLGSMGEVHRVVLLH